MPTIMRLMIAALLWSLVQAAMAQGKAEHITSVSPLHGKLASIYPLSADCCCPVSIVANSRPPRQEAHTFNKNDSTPVPPAIWPNSRCAISRPRQRLTGCKIVPPPPD
jgi:hypothetical protein